MSNFRAAWTWCAIVTISALMVILSAWAVQSLIVSSLDSNRIKVIRVVPSGEFVYGANVIDGPPTVVIEIDGEVYCFLAVRLEDLIKDLKQREMKRRLQHGNLSRN